MKVLGKEHHSAICEPQWFRLLVFHVDLYHYTTLKSFHLYILAYSCHFNLYHILNVSIQLTESCYTKNFLWRHKSDYIINHSKNNSNIVESQYIHKPLYDKKLCFLGIILWDCANVIKSITVWTWQCTDTRPLLVCLIIMINQFWSCFIFLFAILE